LAAHRRRPARERGCRGLDGTGSGSNDVITSNDVELGRVLEGPGVGV
jgi:hypothetical protein